MADAPSPGDVLITSESGRHFLSIVPYPHRLSMAQFSPAFQMAKRWADAHNVSIWRADGGVVTKLPRD